MLEYIIVTYHSAGHFSTQSQSCDHYTLFPAYNVLLYPSIRVRVSNDFEHSAVSLSEILIKICFLPLQIN